MSRRFLLLLVVLVCVLSTITVFLIIKYIDPYTSNLLVGASFLISFILSISTFVTLILFFIKKIHYRGEVLMHHVSSSFRQGLFVGIFFIGLGIFTRIGVPLVFASIIFFVLLVFLELFIQSVFS